MNNALVSIIASILISSANPQQTVSTTTKPLEKIVTTTQPATRPAIISLFSQITALEWKPEDLTGAIQKQSKPWFYFNRSWDNVNYISNNQEYLARSNYLMSYNPELIGKFALIDLVDKKIYSIDLSDEKILKKIQEPKIISVTNDRKVLYQANKDVLVIADLINLKKHFYFLRTQLDNIKLTDKNFNFIVQKEKDAYVFNQNGIPIFYKPSAEIRAHNEDGSVLILENFVSKTYSRYDSKLNQDLDIWFKKPRDFFHLSPNGKFAVSSYNFDQKELFENEPISIIDVYIHPSQFFNIRKKGRGKYLISFIVPTRVTDTGALGVIEAGIYRTDTKFPNYEFLFSLRDIPKYLGLFGNMDYVRRKELLEWKFEIREGKAQDSFQR